MPITKFKITTAPIRSTIEISAIPFVLNQEYPISKQSEMIAFVTGSGSPYDSFGFKLGNEKGIWSSEQFCSINVKVGTGDPLGTNISLLIKLNEITDITNDFVFDTNTDRIRFLSHGVPKYGKIQINGIDMEILKTYFLYEFTNVKWISSYAGSLQNVKDYISFNVGNEASWSPNNLLILTSRGNMQCSINNEEDFLSITATLTSS